MHCWLQCCITFRKQYGNIIKIIYEYDALVLWSIILTVTKFPWTFHPVSVNLTSCNHYSTTSTLGNWHCRNRNHTQMEPGINVLHSICQQIWKTQQWSQDWKRSVFIPISKKGNPKECSNYHRTIALIWHASKVTLKILQARHQQYMSCEISDV